MTRKTAPRRRATRAPQPRPEYPQRWLERYGRTLTGDEIRLVQAYRGIDADAQADLRHRSSLLVLSRPTCPSKRQREADRLHDRITRALQAVRQLQPQRDR